MADDKPDPDDEKLAGIFARGLEIYEERKAEKDAKDQAAKDAAKSNDGSGDKPPAKGWRERLLG